MWCGRRPACRSPAVHNRFAHGRSDSRHAGPPGAENPRRVPSKGNANSPSRSPCQQQIDCPHELTTGTLRAERRPNRPCSARIEPSGLSPVRMAWTRRAAESPPTGLSDRLASPSARGKISAPSHPSPGPSPGQFRRPCPLASHRPARSSARWPLERLLRAERLVPTQPCCGCQAFPSRRRPGGSQSRFVLPAPRPCGRLGRRWSEIPEQRQKFQQEKTEATEPDITSPLPPLSPVHPTLPPLGNLSRSLLHDPAIGSPARLRARQEGTNHGYRSWTGM